MTFNRVWVFCIALGLGVVVAGFYAYKHWHPLSSKLSSNREITQDRSKVRMTTSDVTEVDISFDLDRCKQTLQKIVNAERDLAKKLLGFDCTVDEINLNNEETQKFATYKIFLEGAKTKFFPLHPYLLTLPSGHSIDVAYLIVLYEHGRIAVRFKAEPRFDGNEALTQEQFQNSVLEAITNSEENQFFQRNFTLPVIVYY